VEEGASERDHRALGIQRQHGVAGVVDVRKIEGVGDVLARRGPSGGRHAPPPPSRRGWRRCRPPSRCATTRPPGAAAAPRSDPPASELVDAPTQRQLTHPRHCRRAGARPDRPAPLTGAGLLERQPCLLRGVLGGSLGRGALLGRLGTCGGGVVRGDLVRGILSLVGLGDRLGGGLGDILILGRRGAAAAAFLVDFGFGLTGSRTSSITAMGALSPLRLPIFVMRV
jgi:hypothetical protein